MVVAARRYRRRRRAFVAVVGEFSTAAASDLLPLKRKRRLNMWWLCGRATVAGLW